MRNFFTTLTLLATLTACSTETFEIAPLWSTGDTKTIVFTVDRESQMTISGSASFSSTSRSEIWIDYEISAVDANNGASFAFTFQRAELNETVTANGNTLVPFAGADGISPLQKMYAALKGQTFYATVDATGGVISMDGVETIVDHLKRTAPATGGMIPSIELEQDELDQLTESFAESFDEAPITGLLETVFHIYPGKSVEAGDSWATQSEGTYAASTGIANTVWKLVSVDGNTIHLSFTIASDEAHGEFGEITTGTGTGTATLDASTGLLTGLEAMIKNVMSNTTDGVTIRDEATQNVTIEVF